MYDTPKSGDLVRLRSGGPLMTATDVDGNDVTVAWWGKGKLREATVANAAVIVLARNHTHADVTNAVYRRVLARLGTEAVLPALQELQKQLHERGRVYTDDPSLVVDGDEFRRVLEDWPSERYGIGKALQDAN